MKAKLEEKAAIIEEALENLLLLLGGMGLTGAIVKVVHNAREALSFLKAAGANLALLGKTILESAPFRQLCRLTRKKKRVIANEGIEPILEEEEDLWDHQE